MIKALPHLRSIPFDLPPLRGRDADHRLHCPEAVDVRAILEHIGEHATPPRIAAARGPPEWYEGSGEEAIDAVDDHQGDPLAQPEPEYKYDQRLSW